MTGHPFFHERYTRSNGYDPDWVIENQMGPNALWLLESLIEDMGSQAQVADTTAAARAEVATDPVLFDGVIVGRQFDFYIFGFGEHRHRGRRRVDPTLRFRFRNTLDAVNLPSDAFVRSYSPNGFLLPPIFTPVRHARRLASPM